MDSTLERASVQEDPAGTPEEVMDRGSASPETLLNRASEPATTVGDAAKCCRDREDISSCQPIASAHDISGHGGVSITIDDGAEEPVIAEDAAPSSIAELLAATRRKSRELVAQTTNSLLSGLHLEQEQASWEVTGTERPSAKRRRIG